MATSSQKRSELKKLAKQSRENIFRMLQIVDELLEDKEYVDQFGGEAQLMDHIEVEEFAHFGGNPALSSMLRAFRANPKKSTWAEYRYNIRAMIDLASPEKESGETQRTNWKALAKELQLKLEQAEATLNDYREQVGAMREKVSESERERGILEGRIVELEKSRRAA